VPFGGYPSERAKPSSFGTPLERCLASPQHHRSPRHTATARPRLGIWTVPDKHTRREPSKTFSALSDVIKTRYAICPYVR
jgi:hypothetical protein